MTTVRVPKVPSPDDFMNDDTTQRWVTNSAHELYECVGDEPLVDATFNEMEECFTELEFEPPRPTSTATTCRTSCRRP